MRKRVGVILAILLVLFCVSLGLAKSKDKDGQREAGAVITIDALMQFGELERSAVQFPHEQHTAAMPEADCLSCHDEKKGETPGLSFQFKRQESLDKEALKDLYHDQCISCHAERAVAKKPTGPQTCNACHINDLEEPSTPDEVRFNAVLHASHADKASLECNSCHHAYSPLEKKAVYVKGEEGSCAYCHMESVPETVAEDMPASSLQTASHDQCLNCHLETQKKQEEQRAEVKTGPLLCSECHTSEPVESARPVPEKMRLKRNQPDAVVIGAKAFADNPDKALVPFNHKAHELADISCQSCHHKSLTSCTECHTPTGSEKGGRVTLETAMHTKRSDRSCIACHNEVKKAPECAGCHLAMKETPEASSDSCIACHSLKKEEGKPLPEGEALAQMMEMRRMPEPSTWRKNAPEKVTIDDLAKEYKPAVFPHKKIVDALADGVSQSGMASVFHGSDQALCQGCHHNAPATEKPAQCASCHTKERVTKVGARPDLMGAFHLQCMECHDNMDIELKGDCTACHASLTPASTK